MIWLSIGCVRRMVPPNLQLAMVILDTADPSIVGIESDGVKPVVHVVTVAVAGAAVPTDDPNTSLDHPWLQSNSCLPASVICVINVLKRTRNVRSGNIVNLLAGEFSPVTIQNDNVMVGTPL